MQNWVLCATVLGMLMGCGSSVTEKVNLAFGQSESLAVEGGKIRYAALSGYCVDKINENKDNPSHSILMTSCSRVKSGAKGLRQNFEPAIISSQVSKSKSQFVGEDFLPAARTFMDTGQFTSGFEVLSLQTYQNAVISEVAFQPGTIIDGLNARGWFILQNIDGHLVTHRVFRSTKTTLKQSDTLKISRKLIEKMAQLNS